MNYIIIRMPDGTYAKMPVDSAPPPITPPPPPPPPPQGDWVTRPEFQEAVNELKAKDQDLQEQIDELRSQIEDGLPSGEIAERLESLEQEQERIRNLIKDLEQGGGENLIERLEALEQEQERIRNFIEDLEQDGVGTLVERLEALEQEQERIRNLIEDLEQGGGGNLVERVKVLEDKRLLIAIRETTESSVISRNYQLKYSGGVIDPSYITVLNEDGSEPAFTAAGEPITATLDEYGLVTLSHVPNQRVTFIFGAEVSFSDLPVNAFQQHFVTELERKAQLILKVDRIDKDLEIQEITPSALSATAIGDQVYLSWAYKDTPKLSHFIVEVFDPGTGRWVPYDGQSGVVPKSTTPD